MQLHHDFGAKPFFAACWWQPQISALRGSTQESWGCLLAPVEIAPDEIAFDEIVPDPVFEIPVAAQKKKKFRLFRKNSKSTLETTPEAAMEQAAKKQKRGPIKGAIKKIGKAAKKGTKNVLNFIRQKKKSGAQEKSSH